jgi:hypothetical protein
MAWRALVALVAVAGADIEAGCGGCPGEPPPSQPISGADGIAGEVGTDEGAAEMRSGDETPPQITLTEPSPGAAVQGASLRVSGTVADPQGPNGAAPTGVVEVYVNGHPATLEAASTFTRALTDLAPGDAQVITVTAIDGAGNMGTASVQVDVEALLLSLEARPSFVAMKELGGNATLEMKARYEGALVLPVTEGLSFKMGDAAIASVNAQGKITALAAGETVVTVTLQGVSLEVSVHVRPDLDPPAAPAIATYLAETNLTQQAWVGTAEPGAQLEVQGTKLPLTLVVDPDGRFRANLELEQGVTNPITVVLTDALNNHSAAYPFPIRQDPSLGDAGAIHVASGNVQRGLFGDRLPDPLVVRATDAQGKALLGARVVFEAVEGGGALAATADAPAGTRGASLEVATDGEGYARATYWLGAETGNTARICARLMGDTGLPAIFTVVGETPSPLPATVSGTVLDEHRRAVVGATVHLMDTPLSTQTDERGHFTLGFAPVVPEPQQVTKGRLLVNGYTAQTGGVPGQFARIVFDVTILPGRPNRVLRPLFTPFVPPGVELAVDAQGKTTQTVVLERHFDPAIPPTRITVAAGTQITWTEGLPAAQKRLSLIDIPVNRTPMSLPDGLFTSHVIAVQPGGTLFEPPLRMEMPNTEGLAPGAQAPQLSYSHALGRFVPSGTATVTADGASVVTDPGSGIRVAAWHGLPPQRAPDTVNVSATPEPEDDGTGAPGGVAQASPPCSCTTAGVTVPCERGKRVDFGSISAPPGPAQEVEVQCDDPRKTIQIVFPMRRPDNTIPVPLNRPIKFMAAAKGGQSGVIVAWGGSAVTQASKAEPKGKAFEGTWDKPGTYVLTVGCASPCEGGDSVVVNAMDCCEAGSMRACGDDVAEAGLTPWGTPKFRVSGNVTLGHGESQFIRIVATKPSEDFVDCFTETPLAKIQGEGRWEIESFLLILTRGERETFVPFHGPFIVKHDGQVTWGDEQGNFKGQPGGDPFEIFGINLDVTKSPGLITTDALGLPTVQLKLKLFEVAKQLAEEVGEGAAQCFVQKIDLDFEGVQISPVNGTQFGAALEFKGYLVPAPLPLALRRLAGGFDMVGKRLFFGMGLDIGPLSPPVPIKGCLPAFQLAFGLDFEVGARDNKITDVSITATLPDSTPFGRGLAIPTAGPIPAFFLRKVKLSGKNIDWFFDPAHAQRGPIFSGGVELGVGPTIPIPDGEETVGILKLSGGMEFAPDKLVAEGEALWLVESDATGDAGLIRGTMKASLTDHPSAGRLEGSVQVGFGKTKGLIQGDILQGSGAIGVSEEHGISVQAELAGQLNVPGLSFFDIIEIKPTKLAGASGFFLYRHEPKELRVQVSAEAMLPPFGTFRVAGGVKDRGGVEEKFFTVCLDASAGMDALLEFVAGESSKTNGAWCVGSLELSREIYTGDGMAVEVPNGLEVVEVALTHSAGTDPVRFDLRMPDGPILAADAQAGTLAHPALFIRGPLPGRSTWLVFDAPGGTYQVLGVEPVEAAQEVIVAIPDGVATLSFAEPFVQGEDSVEIAWTAYDPDSGGSVELVYAPTPSVAGGKSIASFDLDDGLTELIWDTSTVPAGTWFVCARIGGGAAISTESCAHQPVVLSGGPQTVAPPRLARAVPAGEGELAVSWFLPASGAASTFSVSAVPETGSGVDASAGIRGDATGLVLGGLVPGRAYRVSVTAADAVQAQSLPSTARGVAGGDPAPVVASLPQRFLASGMPWSYEVRFAAGAPSVVAPIEAPLGIQVQGAKLAWTPSPADVGVHEVTLAVSDAAGAATTQHFSLEVADAGSIAPPEFVSRAPLEATAGVAWSYTPKVVLVDGTVPVLELLTGPPGMTLDKGTLA